MLGPLKKFFKVHKQKKGHQVICSINPSIPSFHFNHHTTLYQPFPPLLGPLATAGAADG
jgi:hypothetical protein